MALVGGSIPPLAEKVGGTQPFTKKDVPGRRPSFPALSGRGEAEVQGIAAGYRTRNGGTPYDADPAHGDVA